MKKLSALACLAQFAAATPGLAQTVTTDRGAIQGTTTSGIANFKGIPYAAPPVGELRWRPPQPALAWAGVRKAANYAPACPQSERYPLDAPEEATSEDCLTLNVWTPAGTKPGKLPVMVWIHGGGLQSGSGSVPLYSGERLARRGVIVVTINYRLGALGFLAHPELNRESAWGGSGNYGLLDQIAALEWVQRNIAGFGGDPRRVTILGQSSGAFSVSALTVSPRSQGLFQQAIAQSGGIFEPVELDPKFNPAGAAEAGTEFARRAGAASLADLRKLPADTLLKLPFHPQFNLDNHTLTMTPRTAYARGMQHKINLLIGSNAEEGEFFYEGGKLTAANYRKMLGRYFPAPLIDAARPDPATTDAEARKAAIAVDTDIRFRWDMWAWAKAAANTGRGGTYLYEFARKPPFAPGENYFGQGAIHGVEMAYTFDHLDQFRTAWTRPDRKLAETMAGYWTNFAKTGNPNGRGLPNWPLFAAETGPVMHFDAETSVTAVRDLARLQRIEQIYTAFANSAPKN